MHLYKKFVFGLSAILLSQFILAIGSVIVSKDYFIPYISSNSEKTVTPQKIHLREKRLSAVTNAKVVVLLNPLSIPSLTAFDIPNYSLMDTLALNGFDVWAIDFIGEGQSSYPEVMENREAAIGVWPLSADSAVVQLANAAKFIRAHSQKQHFSLLGWSWGSIVAAMYAIKYPGEVDKLILYGAMYSMDLPQFLKPYVNANNQFNMLLPAYQNVPWVMIYMHWQMMKQHSRDPNIVSKADIAAIRTAYRQIDPHPFIPGSIRRPMGPMHDLFNIWTNQPLYDIKQITEPTLVVYGAQDLFADPNMYAQLINAKKRREVKIDNATHWVLYEKNRTVFNSAIINFLHQD
jgi:pimeloyl-ACP methyl ester carboxylesterase